MSPMDAAGEARLAKLRACIRKKFGSSGSKCRTKRALVMADEGSPSTKTPRTRVRQRIAQASHLSSEQLFVQQFGSGVELMSEEFDLARPTGHPVRLSTSSTTTIQQQQAVIAPTNYFSFASMAISNSSFASSLPAPLTSVHKLTRPKHIRTPRKAAVKRIRGGEGSAEKALLLRKPRLGGASSSSINYTGSSVSAMGHQTVTTLSSSFDTEKAFASVTNQNCKFQPSSYFSVTSPSKFHFPSSATKLLPQRQALRR
ncbi:uncharacterized protein PHALS_12151 [Plasmopara halstedii]|uniref:Uncharacterized protein n=1 Tax=Plasmopara halstedii TaxID=4781 RepID=A0A0P1AL90_PLAHL|nr:uncharacterized protein PHALS_12151 [Plasmopara halstedii]CEG41834.1 hypothetical protein PHALS_12151 [Plasmopara halstedii]|eukprot:XP_024578203.1 hypothetical protein PHALS_12151 [Plasmopara halstedii]